jgi:hypothetical protein
MVTSAFVLLMPSAPKTVLVPGDESPAKSEVGGATKKIAYEVSRIGESYKKPTDYSKLGRHDHNVIGVNDWFAARLTIYNDTIVHDSYPCIVAYTPYSDRLTKPVKYNLASWTIHSYYQLKVDAENITELATGVNKDPWIVPIMGSVANDGGWVNMSMYLTYLTPQEFIDVQAGTHYANTFYGVNAANVTAYFDKIADDGWFAEIQGHFEFDRNACQKFLALTGADLVAAFNAAGADNIAWKWRTEWINDGDANMPLDIWAAYDYSILAGNAPGPYVHIKLDTLNSSANKISLWLWSQSWGAEVLYARYLDKVGIDQYWQPWGEDWYLNGTLSPINGDIQERMTSAYHMTSWKDPDKFVTTWMLEPQHNDYTRDTLAHLQWKSRFDPYYWGYYAAAYHPARTGWLPGQAYYGQDVHYWNTPMNWNLTADQSLVIKLPTGSNRPGGGIEPYWSNTYSLPFAAKAEMLSHLKWGEWVLGHGYPSKLYSTTYYNAATKTITIQGPDTFAQNPNHLAGGSPPYSRINETGSPLFLLDITPVSKYDLTIDEAGPYSAGVAYTLRVTPKNFTGVAVTDWNGTVTLTPPVGITLGASTHTFSGSEASWTTTITASAAGTYNVGSADSYFSLDVSDLFPFTFGAVIVEFPTLLIPVIGAAAVLVALRRRKTTV